MNNNVPSKPTIDGVVRRNVSPMHVAQAASVAAPVPAPSQAPVVRKYTFQQPAPTIKKQRRWGQRMQLAMLVVGGLAGGLVVQNMAIGGGLAAVYGIVALIKRIPSRTTFMLATLSLGAVCLLLLFKPDGQLISNFSSYTFIFLIIGVVTLARESRMPKRISYRKR